MEADNLSEAQDELSGNDIVAKCAQAYLEVSEYMGQCVVVSQSTASLDGAPPQTKLLTAQARFDFKRDIHFNIEGRLIDGAPFSIKSDTIEATLTFLGNEQEQKKLSLAVGAMTGVAMHAPTTIPALLMREPWGFPFHPRIVAVLKGHDILAGHDCFVVVQSDDVSNRVSIFWIDCQSFLLRQMREERGEHEDSEEIKAIKAKRIKQGLDEERNYKVFNSSNLHVFSVEMVVFSSE